MDRNAQRLTRTAASGAKRQEAQRDFPPQGAHYPPLRVTFQKECVQSTKNRTAPLSQAITTQPAPRAATPPHLNSSKACHQTHLSRSRTADGRMDGRPATRWLLGPVISDLAGHSRPLQAPANMQPGPSSSQSDTKTPRISSTR